MTDAPSAAAAPPATRLWAEFAAIFIAVPLVMALGLPPGVIWSGLAGMLVVAIVLLTISRGFSWRSLLARPVIADWRLFAAFIVLTVAVALGLVLWLRPGALFALPLHNERLWIVILVFYPFVSALPQEIVFRALFFGRYGALFPGPRVAIAANAGAFSLAHLFYWNWPAVILTLAGGAIFAWAYREKKSFLFAWLMHALAGQIVFTTGLGIFFFHGAVR